MLPIPNTTDQEPTLSQLPNEIILQIVRLMDTKTLSSIRLLNKQFLEFGNIVKFEFAHFYQRNLETFSSRLFPYLKKICFDKYLPQSEIARILQYCSETLTSVKLSFDATDFGFWKELLKCQNLKEMDLYVHATQGDWKSFDQFVAAEGKHLGSWSNVQKLKIVFLNPLSDYNMLTLPESNFDRFAQFFPNLDSLETDSWMQFPDRLPKTISKLSIECGNRSAKSDMLVQILDCLPYLLELNGSSGLLPLTIPTKPHNTITRFSWTTTNRDPGMFCSLSTWINLFPELRHLRLGSYVASSTPFVIGNIDPKSALPLRSLTLKAPSMDSPDCGNIISELLSVFPSLLELELNRVRAFSGFNKDTPLADFGKLKKLTVLMECSGDECLWLQESILRSCYRTHRNDFIFSFAKYYDYEQEEEEDLADFLVAVSEVSKSISLCVPLSFEPEWLERLSTNVKELELNYNEALSVGEFFGECGRDRWLATLVRLRDRGIKLSGKVTRMLNSDRHW